MKLSMRPKKSNSFNLKQTIQKFSELAARYAQLQAYAPYQPNSKILRINRVWWVDIISPCFHWAKRKSVNYITINYVIRFCWL